MCGRYSLAADLEDIQRRFELFDSELTYSPRYNIAPTQPVLAVTNDEGRQPAYLRWGLFLPGRRAPRLVTALSMRGPRLLRNAPASALHWQGAIVWSSQTVSTNGRGSETPEDPCGS